MDYDLTYRLENEFKSALFDFESLNKQSKRNHFDHHRTLILLKNKLQTLKESLNAFDFNQNDLDNEIIKEIYIDSIPRFMDLLNSIPQHDGYHNIWFEVKSYLNIIIINLTNAPGENDFWRFTSSANILAHILTSLDKIETVPPLLPRSHPDYYDNIRISLNTLSTTSRTYSSAINTLYSIPSKEFIHWSTMSFWHHHLLMVLLEQVHMPTIFNHFQNSIQDFYRSLYFNVNARFNIFFLTFDVLRTYDYSVISRIDTFDCLPSLSFSGLCAELESISSFIDYIESFISSELHLGTINMNDNPSNFVWIQAIRGIKLTISFFLKLIPFLTKEFFNLPVDQLQYSVSSIIHEFIENQRTIKSTFPSRSHDPIYIDLINTITGLIGYVSIKTESILFFDQEIEKISVLRNGLEIKEFPELYFFFDLTTLIVQVNLNKQIDFDSTIANLFVIREYFVNRNRDYISISFLISLLTLFTGKLDSKETSISILNDLNIFFNSQEMSGQLKRECYDYYQFLKKFIQDKSSQSIYDQTATEIKSFDPFSWIIPYLNKFLGNESEKLVYIPFNTNKHRLFN